MDSLVATLEQLSATRYVNAAAYVILLYDHALTLGMEIKLIWPAKWTSAKVLFLYIRYMVPCAMTLYTVQLSGIAQVSLSDQFCRWWLSIVAFLGWSTIASSNFLILLRLWVIWDRNRRIMFGTLLCFVLAQLGGLACASFLVWDMRTVLFWSTQFRMCGFERKRHVEIIWIPGTAFEIVLCAVTWWNALNRPRSSNAPLAAALYRDGLAYFLLLLCLRIMNTILALTAPMGLTFIAMFPVWCATTTTACRLILRLREVSEDQAMAGGHVAVLESSKTGHGDYDELERSGVQIEMLRSVGPSTPVHTSSWQ